MTEVTPKVAGQVIARDKGRCVRCGNPVWGERGVSWSIHHRRPRGNGGTSLAWVNRPANLIVLCGSGVDGCHGRVESRRDEARDKGFLVRLNGKSRPELIPIEHASHGLVLLSDDGTVTPVKEIQKTTT